MIFSKLHSFYWRVKNKIKRTLKKRSWTKNPSNYSTTFFKDGLQLLEPHMLGEATIKKLISNSNAVEEALLILNKLEVNHDITLYWIFMRKD